MRLLPLPLRPPARWHQLVSVRLEGAQTAAATAQPTKGSVDALRKTGGRIQRVQGLQLAIVPVVSLSGPSMVVVIGKRAEA